MSSPTPVRFSDASKEKLTDLQNSTGLKQADVIRLAVEEIFKKHPTHSEMLKAIILWRSVTAKKFKSKGGAS